MKMVFDREEIENILKDHLENEFNLDRSKMGNVTFHYYEASGQLEASIPLDTDSTGHPYR